MRSTHAPSKGAQIATATLLMELVMPSHNVLSVAGVPALQYDLKKTGKKPAITVVANAEFAQS